MPPSSVRVSPDMSEIRRAQQHAHPADVPLGSPKRPMGTAAGSSVGLRVGELKFSSWLVIARGRPR